MPCQREKKNHILGQSGFLPQGMVSVLLPGQGSPPLQGAGLVQERVWVNTPPVPHDLLQVVSDPQALQPPFTTNFKSNSYYMYQCIVSLIS